MSNGWIPTTERLPDQREFIEAEVVGNIHDKSEQQKDQRSTIICRDFMKKGRE